MLKFGRVLDSKTLDQIIMYGSVFVLLAVLGKTEMYWVSSYQQLATKGGK